MLRILPASRRWLVAPALVLMAGACAADRLTDTDGPITGTVASIRVQPPTLTIALGGTSTIAATPLGSDGAPVSVPLTWTSSDPTIVRVSSAGVVTGLRAGSADITATSSTVTGTSHVAVTAATATVSSVQVILGATSLQVAQETMASATMRDVAGNVLAGRAVTWSSSNTAVATVDGTGRVRGVAAGSASIRATSENVTGSAPVTVSTTQQTVASVTLSAPSLALRVGQAATLEATCRDAAGAVVAGRTVTWSSSANNVATVTGGAVSAVSVGGATITATCDTRVATASVQVTAGTGSIWTNEPVGMTVLAESDFSTMAPFIYQQNAASGRLTTDATAPYSPNGVFEFVYPAGFTGGGVGPASLRAPQMSAQRNAKELFWGFYFKGNPEWQNHQSNVNKLLFTWMNGSWNFYVSWHYGRLQVPGKTIDNFINAQINGQQYVANQAGAVSMPPGVWHKVEVYFKASSAAGVADGVFQVWVNGVLTNSYSNISTPAGYLSETYFDPVWGGVSATGKLRDDYIRVDHAYVSVR